ncbi:protein YhfH [Bacillus taeanensis]|uniref:YhfH family protein n=1 Tax=Bacillus taeanensis TaxID=273032 RepID=A0A366XPD5_9BACI|nr:protein YhfH [Bacillus taeanensis]RBW67378.1 YhfH family protein [Bacillus taeanensis]
MIQKSTEFFRNLPPKTCVDCGKKIREQHESYMNQCEHCLSKVYE